MGVWQVLLLVAFYFSVDGLEEDERGEAEEPYQDADDLEHILADVHFVDRSEHVRHLLVV